MVKNGKMVKPEGTLTDGLIGAINIQGAKICKNGKKKSGKSGSFIY